MVLTTQPGKDRRQYALHRYIQKSQQVPHKNKLHHAKEVIENLSLCRQCDWFYEENGICPQCKSSNVSAEALAAVPVPSFNN